MDYRELPKKYVLHIGAAEGDFFARQVDPQPCAMPPEEEYTEEERAALVAIFAELNKRHPPR